MSGSDEIEQLRVENTRLRALGRVLVSNWHEFGPEYQFEEVVAQLERALAPAPEAKPAEPAKAKCWSHGRDYSSCTSQCVYEGPPPQPAKCRCYGVLDPDCLAVDHAKPQPEAAPEDDGGCACTEDAYNPLCPLRHHAGMAVALNARANELAAQQNRDAEAQAKLLWRAEKAERERDDIRRLKTLAFASVETLERDRQAERAAHAETKAKLEHALEDKAEAERQRNISERSRLRYGSEQQTIIDAERKRAEEALCQAGARDHQARVLQSRVAGLETARDQAQAAADELRAALKHVSDCIEEGVEIDMSRIRPVLSAHPGKPAEPCWFNEDGTPCEKGRGHSGACGKPAEKCRCGGRGGMTIQSMLAGCPVHGRKPNPGGKPTETCCERYERETGANAGDCPACDGKPTGGES